MDDREAEAVLLALGSELEWHQSTAGEQGQLCARVGSALYGYGPVSGTVLFRAGYLPADANISAIVFRDYLTSTEAKAACERHYVTGSWD